MLKISNNYIQLAGLVAVLFAAPLAAQETVVQGSPERQSVYKEYVAFHDLDLRERQDQKMLFTRVRHASGRVCSLAYDKASPNEKYAEPLCVRKSYNDA